jgi:hypothetical protein
LECPIAKQDALTLCVLPVVWCGVVEEWGASRWDGFVEHIQWFLLFLLPVKTFHCCSAAYSIFDKNKIDGYIFEWQSPPPPTHHSLAAVIGVTVNEKV